MGMDVIGVRPRGEVGEYFRNNIWWWHPLWQYCNQIAPRICAPCEGSTNDGDGLTAARAEALAELLERSIQDGRCQRHLEEFRAWQEAISKEPCRWCGATGVRRDDVGVQQGMDTKVLDAEDVERLGRSTGWCNGCSGTGTTDPTGRWYGFSTENVESFVAFLRHCGGFRIW